MDYERRWWTCDDEHKLSDAIFRSLDEIKRDGGDDRRRKNLEYIALYENREHLDVELDGYHIPPINVPGNLTFNVCRSCVDVLSAKIAPNKPKPQYLTSDGDFSAQMKAKNRQRFVMGNFQGGDAYRKSQQVFLDAGKCDIGAMAILETDGKIDYERCHPNEFYVDRKAGRHGKPNELFRGRWLPTETVVGLYPKHEEDIRLSATNSSTDLDISHGLLDDVVFVVEAWHLPASKKAKDGRHVVCVRDAVLVDEKWKDDTYPFVFLRWTTLSEGFFGQGLVEQLHGIQEEITELLQKIQDAHRVLGIPWVVRKRGTDTKLGSLTNEIGEVLEYDGESPPTVQIHGIMASEVYNHLDYLFNKSFEDSGISQLSATSKKPAGVESGVALRTLQDTETQRFALLVDAWQQFFLDLARETEKQARRMGNPTATWRMREWTKKVAWKDVSDQDDDERYILQLWPVNLLPDTPAGKLAYVEQMITMGLLTPEEGQSLLDYPDVEAFQRTSNAARDMVEMIVETMLTEGRYIAPTKFLPIMNPDGTPGMALQIVQGAYLRGQVNGWPEERLGLLAQWMDEAVAITMPPMPPAMPAGPMPPAAPPPGPMPPVGPEMNPAAMAA